MANIYKIFTKIMVAILMYYVSKNGAGRKNRKKYKHLCINHHNQMKVRKQKCMISSHRTGDHRVSQLWEKAFHRFSGQKKYTEDKSELASI